MTLVQQKYFTPYTFKFKVCCINYFFIIIAQNLTPNISIGDDRANWVEMWKVMSRSNDGRSAVGESSRQSLFDIILRANAQARSKFCDRTWQKQQVVALIYDWEVVYIFIYQCKDCENDQFTKKLVGQRTLWIWLLCPRSCLLLHRIHIHSCPAWSLKCEHFAQVPNSLLFIISLLAINTIVVIETYLYI